MLSQNFQVRARQRFTIIFSKQGLSKSNNEEAIVKKRFKFFSELFRIKQWVKNTFIFFPLLFSGLFFEPEALISTVVAFAGFCFVSSGLYILNDYLDREKDRLHPKKSQ